MVLPAPSHIPPSLTGPACGNGEFPHHPPTPGVVGAGLSTTLSRRGLNASQRIPAHPGTPKFLLSLCQALCIPSMMGIRTHPCYLILVPHCPAGHQLREVRGRDHQSSIPTFGAETPCGSAQCHQPHPTGLQRWVWVARGVTLLQGPQSLVPRQERCWQSLGSLLFCIFTQGAGFGGNGGYCTGSGWFHGMCQAGPRRTQCPHPHCLWHKPAAGAGGFSSSCKAVAD